MLLRLSCLFVISVVLSCSAASATQNGDSSWRPEQHFINALYSKGRRQIEEAEISPSCRQTALTVLAQAAVADSNKKCESTMEKAEAFGQILKAVWQSVGTLMSDVDMVVNGIPICMSQYGTFNIIGKASCLFTRFMPIVHAIMDVIHYDHFWKDPYQAAKDFSACVNSSSNNVKTIVNNAKTCK